MFSKLHLTTAQTFVLHSLLSLLVGAFGAGGTAVIELVFSSGNVDPRLAPGVGIAAFSAWFVHGFIALRNSPLATQALLDTASELKIPPALVPDIEALVQQLAPFLAGELMKIRTPPVSALQGQQPVRTSTPPAQQPIQQRPSVAPVANPGNYPQGNMPQQQYGGYAQQGNDPSSFYNLATQQVEQVPYSGHSG